METWIPAYDWYLLSKIEHEDVSPGGIALPAPGDYASLRQEKYKRVEPDREIQKNQSRNTGRYSVLAVGPGIFVDIADDIHGNHFLRRPMCAEVGDVVMIQEGAFPIPVDGKILHAAQDFSILAKILDAGTPDERLDVQNDYVFSRQATAVRQSTGGIYMPGVSDPTGNRALPDRFEVLGVGSGPWCVAQIGAKEFEFRRRPMPVKTGDVFSFSGAGFTVVAMGAPMVVTQAYQTAGRFVSQ